MWRHLRRRNESAFDRKPKPRGSREAQEPSAKDYSPGLEYRRKRCVLRQEAQRSHDRATLFLVTWSGLLAADLPECCDKREPFRAILILCLWAIADLLF